MLYVYFGNDVTRVRQRAFDFLHTLMDAEVTVTHITADRYEEGILSELAGGVSLFTPSETIILDMLSEDAEAFQGAKNSVELLSKSSNHFLMIEGSLLAADKKKLQTNATSIEEISAEKKERFNAFLLTEALLRRDKKSLWLLLMEAWKEGLSNEEIVGVLFWQIKILRLVEKTKSAEEAGQKPFVFSKAQRALSNFKKGELDHFSQSLLTMYHDGHAGKQDMSLSLERWVLTL